jgi:acyl-coenzyme A thioesterase PaaI-like protein
MAQAERMTASAEGHADVVAERRHVLQDLGWEVVRSDDGLRGTAVVAPEMHVPGTGHLRTSILAIWADVLAGHLAVDTISPRVPVTLELDVHLYRPAPGGGTITGSGRIVKAGRSVFVASVDFETGEGDPIGFAAATFVPAPDARLTIQMPKNWDQEAAATRPRLTVPFAERAGCERRAPGVAALSHSDEKLNASNTLNGGLIALIVEEALLSLAPGATVASLDMRYLQPVRIGPAVGRAEVREGLGRVEVRDEGNDDRLCVVATSRFFGG